MNQRLIAVLAVVALFGGVLMLSTQTFAREGEQEGGPRIGQQLPPPPQGQQQNKKPEVKNADKPEQGQEGDGTSFGIKPSGEVVIQKAKVTASTGSSVTVTVLGFPISVSLGTSTEVQNGTSTTFTVGDTLNIRGTIDPGTGLITAKAIRNTAVNEQAAQGLRDQIQKLMDQLKKLRPNFGFLQQSQPQQ